MATSIMQRQQFLSPLQGWGITLNQL